MVKEPGFIDEELVFIDSTLRFAPFKRIQGHHPMHLLGV